MVELEGGQHIAEQCLEAVIRRESHYEPFQRYDDGLTRPTGDPGEAGKQDEQPPGDDQSDAA